MTRPLTRRPGRPLGGQLDVSRDVVLDAAERVIARDGANASIDAIAAEAGVTKPIVYDRVGSRADVATALAERLSERMAVAARTALGGRGFTRSSLASFIEANLRTVVDHRDLFLYVTGGSTDQTSLGRLVLAEQSVTPLAKALQNWRQRAGLDPSVADSWAYGMVGMLQMASLWVIGSPSANPRVVADQLAELLWYGLVGERRPDEQSNNYDP
ncbi:MAG: TetR/AcrR family transcriptional regulator [Actinomycetota bacterium]